MRIQFDDITYKIVNPTTDGWYTVEGLRHLGDRDRAMTFEDALKMVLFDVSMVYGLEASLDAERARKGFSAKEGFLACAGGEMQKVFNKEVL